MILIILQNFEILSNGEDAYGEGLRKNLLIQVMVNSMDWV